MDNIARYCNIRMITGSVISGIFGLVLFFVGVFASKITGDTSSYVLTDATVESGDIKAVTVKSGKYSTRTYFDVIYNVGYTVGGKPYTGKVSDRFSSFEQAKRTLDAAKGAVKRIYYNPLDPTINSESKNTEGILRWASFGASTLLLGYAALAWFLRNNMAMCAVQTMSNISNIY